jgi:excinuclease UvrABC ATPase subunit
LGTTAVATTPAATQGWKKHQQEHQPIRATATVETQGWTQLQLEQQIQAIKDWIQQQLEQKKLISTLLDKIVAGVTNLSSTLMNTTAAVAW